MLLTTETIAGVSIMGMAGFVLTMYRYFDNKINRTYQRLDEVKKDNENKYTHQDVCQVRHLQITNDLSEIKQDVKKLLFKNGIS